MSQHDYDLANQAGAAFRSDLNSALTAIVSINSGTTAPATMFAYQLWADTTTGILKQRNAANNAWISLMTLSTGVMFGNASLAGGNFTGGINEARGTVTMHATTMDLWAQPNVIDGTGSGVTITAIINAPQAGARRTLYPVAGTIITNGATFAVDGAANYTTASGDKLEFEAITTSTYKVHVTKKDGTAIVITTGVVTLTGTETLTNKTLTAPVITSTINAQTSTAYVAVLTDTGAFTTISNAAANTYKIPTNASVAFPVGCSIDIMNIGAGLCTISAVTPGTTTLTSAGAVVASPTLAQYKGATFKKTATDTWVVVGGIA